MRSASSSAGGPFASEKAVSLLPPNNVLEPKHMAVHLSFDIPKQTVQGFVRHTINNPRHTPIHEGSVLARELSQITFNAVSLDISAVVDTADGSSLDFDYDGKEIKIQGGEPIAGLYFHVPDEVLKEKVLHCITDHETERARYWLPCVDFPRRQDQFGWLQRKWPEVSVAKVLPDCFARDNGGAMENISLVTYTDRLCIDEVAAKDFVDTVDSVNIHEMAHTYLCKLTYYYELIGDLLVMRHFEHAWLKDFSDLVLLSLLATPASTNFPVLLKNHSILHSPDVTRTYDSSWNMFDSHLYPGGAVRIHMLRPPLGDEVFWSAVKNYVNTFAKQGLETEDFKRCLEQESGLNLTRFFDQWFYGLGFPKLKATYEYVAARKQVLLSSYRAAWEAKPSIVEIDPRGKVYIRLSLTLESKFWSQLSRGKRYRKQVFGVRTQAYLALSAAKTQTAVDILASSLATETHPRALTALLSACTIRAESIRKGILKLLENPSALLTTPVLKLLLTRSTMGDRLERRKTAEAISEYLRDPFHRIRRAALGALKDLEGKEFAGAAAATLAGFPAQDRPAVEKVVKVKEMAATIEDLEGRLKKMEQQMQLLEARQKEEAEAKAKEVKEKEADIKPVTV
ncbi:hypothetical protein BC829DRAFT_416378 [Chytridium lagenaria]|nr:hypothetical protein BC829DRAFT_416378 [Chytridium lagenaria]